MSQPPKQTSSADQQTSNKGSTSEKQSKEVSNTDLVRWNITTSCLLICAVVCVFLIICRWYAGILPQLLFGHDIVVLLEGAWKWKWGIVPHRDFYSPFGALNFAIVAWSCGLVGIAKALPAAVCLVAAGVLPLALYATFTRMKPVVASIATFVIIAQALAPHALRFSAAEWTYAGVYNRWAFALFSIALLVMTTPPVFASRRKDFADGLIATLCVAASVMIKISYGLLLAVAFVAFAVIQRRRLGYYGGALTAAILSFVTAGLALHWSFADMLHDTSMAAHARAGLGVSDFFASTLYLYPELCTTLMLAGLGLFTILNFGATWMSAARTLVLYACCAGCSVAIAASNSPLGDYREGPLLNVYALLVFATIYGWGKTVSNSPPGRKHPWKKFVAAAWIMMAVVLFFFIPASNTLAFRPISQYTSSSLLTAEAVICIVGWIAVMTVTTRQRTVVMVFAATILAFTAAPSVIRNVESLARGVSVTARNETLPPNQVFDSGGLKGVQIKDTGGEPMGPTTFVGKVKEGLELLQQQGESKSVIAVLDFCNPFDVAREVKPSKGTPICWQLGFVYSDKIIPPASQVFEGVDAVLIAKQFGDGNQENLRVLFQHYGSYIDTNFVITAQSQQWLLAKRKH